MRYLTYTPEGDYIASNATAQKAGDTAANWLESNPSAEFCYSVDFNPGPFRFSRHERMQWPAIGWPTSVHATLAECLKG